MHVAYDIISLPLTPVARKVNIIQDFASFNRSIGDSFFIPCNIELGVNTAQTNYILNIERNIVYPDRNTLSPLLQYQHNIDPEIKSLNSSAMDPTSYTFYSGNLTLYVENFSVPSPQDVRGVKFLFEFRVILQGRTISAETATAVIPGFCKFIANHTWNAHLYYCTEIITFSTTDPPTITASLDDITIIPQGSNHTFMVEVYSHPPSRVHSWRLNGTEISALDQHYVMKGPIISGNTSNFSLTILNARLAQSCIYLWCISCKMNASKL